jgi:hypothetical protein
MVNYAVGIGCLRVVKWLHQNGCPWDVSTTIVAAEYSRWEVVQWLLENGCPWDVSIGTKVDK